MLLVAIASLLASQRSEAACMPGPERVGRPLRRVVPLHERFSLGAGCTQRQFRAGARFSRSIALSRRSESVAASVEGALQRRRVAYTRAIVPIEVQPAAAHVRV